MYSIGQFSKMSKTTIKALRYYEEVGMLMPEEVDAFTGYRFYSTNQLIKLHQIKAYRQVGLSIKEIKIIMSGHSSKDILEKRKEEVITQIFEANTQLSRLEFILKRGQEDDFMNYVATIKELPECIVYSKRVTIPNYDAYFDVIPTIGKIVSEKYPDLKCMQPEYCFIRYLDSEYKEENFKVEFCEAVDKMKTDFDDILFKKISSVKAVSVLHTGPYSELSKAYAFALEWIEENEYVAKDAPRENYIDGIWNKENQEEWLTEIQIPIKTKLA